ncbi:MAG TPA: DNA polymerase IV [Acidimicrobiia bacterium]|nr:DNA polymerase IV [Acidimicrobiia bacterium]
MSAILHVDLDAFYASVEQLEHPELAGRPVIVGGLGPRGVVAAASYEARRFGVFSATPMARARHACPDGVFLAPRFERYGEKSREVMEILRSFTPVVEPVASDEAFLDVSGTERVHGSARACAEAIRHRVREETGLTASVGVASTKLVAKLASDLAKPDGLLVVEPGTELAFLHPLPVERLWGVGPATRRRLAELGVVTVGDLARLPEPTLVSSLGAAHGHHLHELARNRDTRPVQPDREVKSIGHEETFATDVTDRTRLEREVARLADGVAARLRRAGRVGRTVQLKVRYPSFRTITRSRTLREPTDLAGDIAAVAQALLRDVEGLAGGVRLLGVSVQQLTAPTVLQPDLFGPATGAEAPTPGAPREERAALERAVDAVRARFGDDAVGPARGPEGGRRALPSRVEQPPTVRENGNA